MAGGANPQPGEIALSLARLNAIEDFDAVGGTVVVQAGVTLDRTSPFAARHPLYVLIETLGSDAHAGCAAVVADAIVAPSAGQAAQLWAIRDGVSELLSRLRPCAAFDISVAMPAMDALVRDLRTVLEGRFPSQQHLFFGHLGDGNLHLLTGPFVDASQREAVEELVYRAVGAARGSISAEHGIGVVKKPFLHHSRDAAQIDLMQGLRQLLDPGRILNRGRVVEDLDRR